MTTKEVLIAARALIADYKHWTRNANARDGNGEEVEPGDAAACKWCVNGALVKAAGGFTAAYASAFNALSGFVDEPYDPTHYNDTPMTQGGLGHKGILAAFDRAIEAA